MTETENKYFSIDICNNNSISFHSNEEEAKEECLNCAEEFHQQCVDDQDMQFYEDCVDSAIYGLVLGKAESKSRSLNEKDDGWISVKDRLPERNQDVLVAFWTGGNYGISFATYKKYDGEMAFVEPNYGYYGIDEVTTECDFWRPLPQPPQG